MQGERTVKKDVVYGEENPWRISDKSEQLMAKMGFPDILNLRKLAPKDLVLAMVAIRRCLIQDPDDNILRIKTATIK
jgi:hypothetical protein